MDANPRAGAGIGRGIGWVSIRAPVRPAHARLLVVRQPHKEPGTLRIVMSHFPDHCRRIRPLAADVFLAGHTHGEQICTPWGWPLITHDRMPRRYCKGVHRFDGTWYIVSRGLGFG